MKETSGFLYSLCRKCTGNINFPILFHECGICSFLYIYPASRNLDNSWKFSSQESSGNLQFFAVQVPVGWSKGVHTSGILTPETLWTAMKFCIVIQTLVTICSNHADKNIYALVHSSQGFFVGRKTLACKYLH